MTVITDIKTVNWQISTAGFGVIAEGLEDVRQCLDILLRTSRGSDNLRPEFGSDIFRYVDAPINVAIPNIKRCIIEAVEIWEQRIVLVDVEHYIEKSTLQFKVTFRLRDQDLIDSLVINTSGAVTTGTQGGLILQAFYPPNPNSNLYAISLVLNGINAVPTPPSSFLTITGIYDWVVNNWGYLGRWVQLADRLILYTKEYYNSASISIHLLTGVSRFAAPIPELVPGQHYKVKLSTEVEIPQDVLTKGSLLAYMQQNYSNWGEWTVEAGGVDLLGDFNAIDFSSDFYVAVSDGYFLVLISNTITAGELVVTAVINP